MNDRYRRDDDDELGSISFGEDRHDEWRGRNQQDRYGGSGDNYGSRDARNRSREAHYGGSQGSYGSQVNYGSPGNYGGSRQGSYGGSRQGGYGASSEGGYRGSDYGAPRDGGYGSSRAGYRGQESQEYGGDDYARRRGHSQGESDSWRGFDPWRPSERNEDLGWSRTQSMTTPRSGSYGSSSQYGGSAYGSSDWQRRREGGFYGKGPKGYTRSDERIREDISDRLTDDDEVDASEITITVKDGEVTLQGSVSDRRSKHRAEDIADSVTGVKDVHNQLKTRKGFLQEVGDRLTGKDETEQRGHSGEGPRNGIGVSSASSTSARGK